MFETADGPLNIAPAKPEMWIKLCSLLDCPELASDPRFTSNQKRVEHRLELERIIDPKLQAHTRAEWTARFLAAGIPAGPINNLAEVFADPQVVHSRLVEEVEHPILGMVKQIAMPLQMNGLNSAVGTVRTAPPMLGEHTRQVLSEFGFNSDTIEQWLDEQVVQQYDRNIDAARAARRHQSQ